MATVTQSNSALAVVESEAEGVVISLRREGAEHYQRMAAARLKAIRVLRGFDLQQMANGLSDALGQMIAPRALEMWESGAEPFVAGVLGAALDVTGVTEAEVLGLENPDIGTINRLECAIARVRALLNDPAALTQRAADILSGRAHALHPVFD